MLTPTAALAIAGPCGALQQGDLPSWIEALATVAAVAAALFAGYYAKRLNDIEDKRDVERFRADWRRQAEQVSAWMGLRFSQLDLPIGKAVWIRSVSDQPVYAVASWMIYPNRRVRVDHPELVLAPGAPNSDIVIDAPKTQDPLGVAVQFRDSAGRWWRRDETGILHELERAEDRWT